MIVDILDENIIYLNKKIMYNTYNKIKRYGRI